MPISTRYVIRSTFALVFVGFVALMSIVGMTFWLGLRAQVYFDEAIAARDTRTAAADLRSAVQAAETSQRGFIAAGNEIYLAPYTTAKAQAQRQLSALKQLLATMPEFQVSLDRLTSIISDKFEEMDQTITLKRGQHDDEALAILKTNRGKALMDEANVFFSGIIRQADDRLTQGANEQNNNADLLRIVSGIGALVIISVVGGAAYVLSQYTRELRAARDEVTGLNADLEKRVSSRTADLAQSRDRAQVLLSEVNHRVANSLALVSSMVGLQAKSLSSGAAKEALAETQERIFAISLVHKRLYDSNDVRVVALDEYLTALLDHLQTSLRSDGQGTTLIYALEPLSLETDSSINLGVIVTEWVTNAFKYAYPGGRGEIRVRLRQLAEGDIELAVEDDGVGRAEGVPALGTGVGTRIVTAMAASLSAEIEYRSNDPGTAAILTFPGASSRVVS